MSRADVTSGFDESIDFARSGEAWTRHRAWLRRLAATLVVDAARADDLTQQALLAAFERPPADSSRLRPWLAAVARNLARRFGTSDRRRADREHAASTAESQPSAADVVAEAALHHEVSAAVLALDEPYRTALLLRFFKDLPPRAIGKRLGIPAETARTRVNRGIELLRARLVSGRAAGGMERALGLVALLDGPARFAVKRVLLWSPAGTGATTGGSVGALGTFGLLGVLVMSTKVKITAAALVVAAVAAILLAPDDRSAPPRGAIQVLDSTLQSGEVSDSSPSVSPAAEATRVAEPAPSAEDAPALGPASVPKTCVVAGIVQTAQGDPVPDAVVLLESAERGSTTFGSLEELCTRADDLLTPSGEDVDRFHRTNSAVDGSFRFEGIEPTQLANVAAIHSREGIAVQCGLALAPERPAGSVELTLIAGVSVHGTIRDPEGRPIPGAFVAIFSWQEDEENPYRFSSWRQAKADGTYRTVPLPLRFMTFQFGAEGFLETTHRKPGAKRVGPDSWIEVPIGAREYLLNFTLTPAPTITGRIVLVDGSPAHLADVERELSLIGSRNRPSAADSPRFLGEHGIVHRDDDGYEITPRVGRPGFLSLWSGDALLGVVPAGEDDLGPDLEIDLSRLETLPPATRLALEVVDSSNGEPVRDFRIVARLDRIAEGPDRDATRRAWVREDDGIARFEDVKPGTYSVEVRADGYAPRFEFVDSARDTSDPPVRFELERGDSGIAGRVLDEHGRTLAGAEVALLGPDGRVTLPFPEWLTTTNSSGEFRFGSIPDGDWCVVASKEDLAPSCRKVSAGTDDLDLILRAGALVSLVPRTRTGDSAAIVIRIRNELGVPVVDHHRPGLMRFGALCQHSFRLEPGEYAVELFAARFRAAPVLFTARPGAEVEVVLEPIDLGASSSEH